MRIDLKILLGLAFTLLVFSVDRAEGQETHTRTVQLCAIDVTYSDFSAFIDRVRSFRVEANRDLTRRLAEQDKYLSERESLTVQSKTSKFTLARDFSKSIMHRGPEIADEVHYVFTADSGRFPISEIFLRFGDYSRTAEVSGTIRNQVEGLVLIIEQQIQKFGCPYGGAAARMVLYIALYLFAMVLVFLPIAASAASENTYFSRISRMEVAIAFWVGAAMLIISIFVMPWDQWLAGTSIRVTKATFLERYAPEVGLIGMIFGMLSVVIALRHGRRFYARDHK
ncbi:MAG: hypothetical protein GEU76_12000 [Alphaproteobacteria bacterium]|nr:hypothetical protein [Alphaproteobacteria bacterium]